MTGTFSFLAQANNLTPNQQAAATAGMLGAGIFGFALFLIELTLIVLWIVGMWKVFTKAGQPGWAAIIPFYNFYVLLQIAGRPGWWLLLYFIPIVSLVIHVIVCIDVSKKFGQGAAFAIGLVFLPFIFFLMLGFGSATYQPQARGFDINNPTA